MFSINVQAPDIMSLLNGHHDNEFFPINTGSNDIDKDNGHMSKQQSKQNVQHNDCLRWINRHHDEISQHSGKYIAISNGCIAGVGTTSATAYRMAKNAYPNHEPVLHLVPPKQLCI